MTRLLHRHRDDETPIPCATPHPAPAAHLGRRRDRDRHIGFDDVVAMPEPEWSRPDAAKFDFCPGRFSPEALVPPSQLVMIPLPDPTAEEMVGLAAEITAAVEALPYIRHEVWFAMALAPISAQLTEQPASHAESEASL